jgi:hypothetical protein
VGRRQDHRQRCHARRDPHQPDAPRRPRHPGPLSASGAPELPWKTTAQGAATSVLVATSSLLDGVSGRYFEDCNEAEPLNPDNPHGGVADYALDPDNAARLWDVSVEALAGP